MIIITKGVINCARKTELNLKSEYFAGEAHHCIFQKTCTPSLVSSAIDSDSPHVCKQPYDLPASLQVLFSPLSVASLGKRAAL